MTAAIEHSRPLLRENSTFAQRNKRMEHERERRATVISVMLADETAPSVFNHYMQLTRRQVEIDLRQLGEKVLGAVRSSLDVDLELRARSRELHNEIRERVTFCADMRGRYGSELECEQPLDLDAPIDTSASWFRQLEPAQQQTVSTIQNLRQHSELIDTLASFVVPPAGASADERASSPSPRVVAQATFFHALDSSRALQTMVCARHCDQRLAVHGALPRQQAETFFAQLAKITAEFNEVAIKSPEYVARIRSVFHTGMAACPIPRNTLEKVAKQQQ